MSEYMSRMDVLAEEINNETNPESHAIGIRMNPRVVEWGEYHAMRNTTPGYDGLFFFENLHGEQWDGASLAEYLETLTRESMED